ncbi:hypothetical protein U9M48_002653 [Paspalum notatum var. saurae]|uniref:NB-ARC domain-containing protein n=1 Tax=Paspalum notatum var. saurae TaxID=547442 RepID=A0AAQ3PHG0_PASNO
MDDGAWEDEDARWRALTKSIDPLVHNTHSVIKLLMDKGSGDHADGGLQHLRVVTVVGQSAVGKTLTAEKVYNDPVVTSFFDFKIWIWVSEIDRDKIPLLLWKLLRGLDVPRDQLNAKEEEKFVEMLQIHLEEGSKVLVVLEDVWDGYSLLSCVKIRSAFADASKCSPGSALLVTTRSNKVANSFSPCESLDIPASLYDSYESNAIDLLSSDSPSIDLVKTIVRKLDTIRIPLFLRSLYANPCRTKKDFQALDHNLDNNWSNNLTQVLLFNYNNGLSNNCKNCLLYPSIFPEDFTLRRISLVRRWIVEGMITRRGRLSVMDEAHLCFNLLIDHRFLLPNVTDVTGKVKSCQMHEVNLDFVISTAIGEGFIKTNHQTDLTHRLSIRQGAELLHATHSKSCWNTCIDFNQSSQKQFDESTATKMFLESLPLLTHLGLLEVLDLEDCKDLQDHHLKNICNHVSKLKYLSLRNTNINKLPKQIVKLWYLETLDIRQTKVQTFTKTPIVLPKLKHLLAGHKNDRASQGIQSEEPFFTVQMPWLIGRMTELQVLSLVAVSSSGNELVDIANLLRLRKLGVILQGPQKQAFRHLYHAIGKLSRSLHILSIRIVAHRENADMDTEMEETLLIPPKYLQTLQISGVVSEFPAWVEKLRELTKLGDINILGKLTSLCCLELWQESCSERTLTFRKDEFQSLKFLIIECTEVTAINFGDKATPKLKNIVWSSTGSQSVTGIEQLPSLKVVKLTGNFDRERLEQAIAANPNGPILETDETADSNQFARVDMLLMAAFTFPESNLHL